MNMTVKKNCVKVSVDQAIEKLSTNEKEFLQSVRAAMQKVRSFGREDAQAGKVLSHNEIYRKLLARFESVDPCFAQGIAELLSNCYAEGVKEVHYA